jgi:type VI secretion system protein ImpK
MTLLELCEPLFQYICFLNRSAKKGAHPDMGPVESEIEGILADMRQKASTTTGLLEQFEKIELPLLGFVDNMICESQLSFARDWPRLAAKQKGELAMDEKFFEILGDTMAEKSTSATERLAVYYTCMGLGFTGWHIGNPDELRRLMRQIEPRIRPLTDSEDRTRVTPDAYKSVNGDDLVEPPAAPVTRILIALFGLIIVVLVANGVLYKSRTKKLSQALEKIVKAE